MTDTTTSRVLADILIERGRQIDLGWTREHDDRHALRELVALSAAQVRKPGTEGPGFYSRERLIEAAAILVAAVETIDRREARRDG